MAILLRGKLKGHVKISQWCNDWFMLESGQIVSPSSLQLDPLEMMEVVNSKHNGILFGLYELTEQGTFKKRKRK